MSRTFQYTERPCGVVLGRRGRIKVVGVCAVVAGATGWGVVELLANRNCILLARQAGLYKDDKLCQKQQLTSSHDNPTVRRIYKDFSASPMDDKMYSLLHTHFSQRSLLALHH